MTLLLLTFGLLVFRYFFIPYADQPDLLVTIPDYIPQIIREEIIQLIQTFPGVSPYNPQTALLFGSVYRSSFHYPSLGLYIISSIPLLLLSSGLYISKFFYPLLPKPFLNRSSFLLLLLPSTSYYLISVKAEAITNAFAMIFVYNFLAICYLTPFNLKPYSKLRRILPLIIYFLFSYFLSTQIYKDNQSVIYFVVGLSAILSYFISPFGRFFQFPQSLSISPVFQEKLVLRSS